MQTELTSIQPLGSFAKVYQPSISKWPARARELKHIIGNTPLLAIRLRFRGRERCIYAKAEHLNLTGSIKDRMAFHILKKANVEAHEKTTGAEIWWQLFFHSIQPDAFVAGVGTGGTIMGVGRFLRARNPAIKLYPLQPAESPTLTVGHKVGLHRIQGISDEFIPPILDLERLDSVVSVHDGDAILMAQKLGTELGLGVGISAGANFIGALMVQNEMGCEATV